nr:integrase, catalytic region, zinc finger, CCHC-type, peptidase aspartic, catalytic [Tanacetum cinerariifolium]
MDLCGPMRVASINGKRYVLVIVNDYSRYTWTHFLRSKDETPKVLIDFLRLVQRGLQAQVRVVRTNKGTEFLNQTLHAYFSAEGIKHQTSIARTPEQNNIVERRNHYDNSGLTPQLQKTFVHNSTELGIQFYNNEPSCSKLVLNVVPTANKTNTSLQELELLFSPMYEEYFNAQNQSASKSFTLFDNLLQQDKPAIVNVQPTLEPIIPSTNVNAQETTIIKQKMHNPKMCMFSLIVSTEEPKNIKEVMDNHAWIEATQEELHQFDRLKVWELIDEPFGKTLINLKW